MDQVEEPIVLHMDGGSFLTKDQRQEKYGEVIEKSAKNAKVEKKQFGDSSDDGLFLPGLTEWNLDDIWRSVNN